MPQIKALNAIASDAKGKAATIFYGRTRRAAGHAQAQRLHDAYLNEWQKVGSRLEAANDRNWVVVAEGKGDRFRPLADILGMIQHEALE